MFGRVSGVGSLWPSRYAAFGAAVAVTVGAGGLVVSLAGPGPAPSSFVPISPCRIMDTRADSTVGPRNTALTAGVPYTIQVQGVNGNCDIPATSTAVNMNVTSTNATAYGFLTVWPSDVERPLSSSLNWVPGQAPTPNSVNATLSPSGQVSFYTNGGTVDLVADITGYFTPASTGPAGATGPPARPCSATLRWDLTTCKIANFALPAGATNPNGIAFDGTNIWTANNNTSNVTRINPATGAGTNYALPAGATNPGAIAFDGTNIWTANFNSANVTRIDPTTGAGTNYALPAGATYPRGIAFDGISIWTTNDAANLNNVTRINPGTGAGVNFSLPAGATYPHGIAFDGTNIWTTNGGTANVTRLVP